MYLLQISNMKPTKTHLHFSKSLKSFQNRIISALMCESHFPRVNHYRKHCIFKLTYNTVTLIKYLEYSISHICNWNLNHPNFMKVMRGRHVNSLFLFLFLYYMLKMCDILQPCYPNYRLTVNYYV